MRVGVTSTELVGDIFEDGDDDGNELVEIDVELRQLGFVVAPTGASL
jgi:hypothetical protein